ncbi:MAG: outer membrane lipoprotein carrier protein LolA [Oligoflexales bacterium]|nr:outer membrane lipoprotein carrier protein LolA [Oligoflexales bacterium]
MSILRILSLSISLSLGLAAPCYLAGATPKKETLPKATPSPKEAPAQSTPTPGEAPNKNDPNLKVEEIRQIQGKMKSYESLSVEFSQSVFKNLRKKTVTSRGEAFFKRPDRFHWRLLSPKPEEWLYDGKDLVNYFPTKKEAVRYSANAAKGRNLRELVDMVLDFNKLLDHHKLVSAVKEPGRILVELAPVDSSEMTKIELVIDEAKNFVSSIKMHFRGGNVTTLSFSSPKFDKFSEAGFKVPEGIKYSQSF